MPTRVHRTAGRKEGLAGHPSAGVGPRFVAAVLAVAVSVIHIKDQGGLTALRDPAYVGHGYWVLEVAGIVCALLLLAPSARAFAAGWLLAVGVAVGPLTGFVISRSVGLPHYTEDVGNWTEPIGVLSLVVESALLLLALWAARGALAEVARPARRSATAEAEYAAQ